MTRRELVRTSLAFGLAGGLRGQTSLSDSTGFHLSVATYSLRNFRRDLAIRMIQRMGITYADVKDFHLPTTDSAHDLSEGRKKFEAAGIRVIAGGNVGMPEDDEPSLRKHFDYARNCGFPVIVCAPTHRNLPIVEKLAKQHDVRIAIHNHGPEDKQFPAPRSVLDAVRDMDPRMGLCIDIGHTARTGADIVASIRDAGPRLFEMHFKDLRDKTDRDSQCIVGEGVLPIPAIFRELRKIGYTGACSLEYEIDEDDPLPGMQRSFAYMRGVVAGQNS